MPTIIRLPSGRYLNLSRLLGTWDDRDRPEVLCCEFSGHTVSRLTGADRDAALRLLNDLAVNGDPNPDARLAELRGTVQLYRERVEGLLRLVGQTAADLRRLTEGEGQAVRVGCGLLNSLADALDAARPPADG